MRLLRQPASFSNHTVARSILDVEADLRQDRRMDALPAAVTAPLARSWRASTASMCCVLQDVPCCPVATHGGQSRKTGMRRRPLEWVAAGQSDQDQSAGSLRFRKLVRRKDGRPVAAGPGDGSGVGGFWRGARLAGELPPSTRLIGCRARGRQTRTTAAAHPRIQNVVPFLTIIGSPLSAKRANPQLRRRGDHPLWVPVSSGFGRGCLTRTPWQWNVGSPRRWGTRSTRYGTRRSR